MNENELPKIFSVDDHVIEPPDVWERWLPEAFRDRDVIDALGPNGVLINISRGSLVDEAALIEALRERRILGAGLDVFENEPHVPEALIALDNAVLLPHVGSASHATRNAMADLVVENVVSWIEGRGPVTPVPETPWPRKA